MITRIIPFLLIIFLATGSFSQDHSTTISGDDTSHLNTLLRKGRALHYDNPDSAIYYYQLITNNPKNRPEALGENPSGLEKAWYETIVRAFNYTGNIYYFNDEYWRSEEYYRNSLKIAEMAGLPEYIAKALFDIGYVYYVNNEYREALGYFRRSCEVYAETDERKYMFDVLQACGLASMRLGDFSRADSCYRMALEIAIAQGDSMMICDYKINAGIMICEQGRMEEGIQLFEEALDYYEKTGEQEAVSSALMNIGVVMQLIREYDKALDYMIRTTGIEEVLQRKSQLFTRYFNLANLYFDMGETEKAYEYCQKSQSVANEIGSRPFIAECNLLMGKYHYSRENYKQAEKHFNLALDSATRVNYNLLLAKTYLWCGKTDLKLGKVHNAISLALQAYQLAEEMKQILIQKEAAEFLSDAYEKTGRIREAFSWNKRYQVHSDSLNQFNLRKEISKIEARYNYEKKEKENELLRNRVSLQEQRIWNRTLTTLILVLAIAFSITIIILLIRRNRMNKLLYRQEQMLTLEKLDELNKELEGKERELTSKMMFLNQKNDLIGRIMKELKEMQKSQNTDYEQLSSIVNELRSESPQGNWKEFETHFTQVHPDFYKRLYEKHPGLTSYEQRICSFLRMNLNSKEIVSITGRSLKSIEVTRSRIRKKLNLTRTDNLNSFLASI